MRAALPRSPAAERNKAPILQQLLAWLGPTGRALEIAAGTGQHAAHFAAALPGWTWQPTDADAAMLPIIDGHGQGVSNLLPARRLDAAALPWPAIGADLDLVYCANMLHIAPWSCCIGLMQGSAAVLGPQGRLVTYGPYRIDGQPFADSNQRFDEDLQARHPAWGIRRLADVSAAASEAGLALIDVVALPANNHLLSFARAPVGH